MTLNTTSGVNDLAKPDLEHAVRSRSWIMRTLLRWGWPLLYAATVVALIWWYEFRPARWGLNDLQGTWRAVTGEPPEERSVDSYCFVDGEDEWFVYDFEGGWRVQRNRISIRPAENFFVVRSAFGFDYGTTREADYFVYLKNDTLYEIRGLADLDPMNAGEIRKLRRTDSLPDVARTAIREYVERISKKQRDEGQPPRP